jgi:hypothetical protein
MPSRVPLTRRVRTFFFPSGKRRRPTTVAAPPPPAVPPRPRRPAGPVPAPATSAKYVVDYGEIQRFLMDRIAADALGTLASFKELYTVSVSRGENAPAPDHTPRATVTGRVTVSSPPGPAMWMSRTPKTLIRQSDVSAVAPTTFHATGLPGLRITLTAPAMDRVATIPVPRVPESASRISKLSQGRTAARADRLTGSVLTDGWNSPHPRREAHVCRGCRQPCEGSQLTDETWQCGACGHVDRY